MRSASLLTFLVDHYGFLLIGLSSDPDVSISCNRSPLMNIGGSLLARDGIAEYTGVRYICSE